MCVKGEHAKRIQGSGTSLVEGPCGQDSSIAKRNWLCFWLLVHTVVEHVLYTSVDPENQAP